MTRFLRKFWRGLAIAVVAVAVVATVALAVGLFTGAVSFFPMTAANAQVLANAPRVFPWLPGLKAIPAGAITPF